MAIRTFPSQERYSKNRGGAAEPRKKLKKLRSVKVANLDRFWLSMRREKSRFNHSIESPSDDASDRMSGSSSPNYMKATTSSSARKGSSQISSSKLQYSSASSSGSGTPVRKKDPSSTAKPSSKFNKVSVVECSDPAGVSIPVDIKLGKSQKRVFTVKGSKKLSSMKSMRLRAKYSQFREVGDNKPETSSLHIPELDDVMGTGGTEPEEKSEGMIDNVAIEKESMVKVGANLERSRSIKLNRLRSIRSSRRRPKSRLGGGSTTQTSNKADMFDAEPRYMKGTGTQETRKNLAKGLTRTSSLRPLRILAKIPSLRPRRSKVKKRPEVIPLSDKSVDRATCSSSLKSSKFPDKRELHSGLGEVCPYSYCSLHSHHHHAPSSPLKDFISTKRQKLKNQKGKQLDNQSKEEVQHSTSVTETNHSTQIVAAESPETEEMTIARIANDTEVEDTGKDFHIKIYTKPGKKWDTEGSRSEDAEALKGSVSNPINVQDYSCRVAEMLANPSRPEAIQEALDDGQPQSYPIFNLCNIEPDDKIQQHTNKIAVSSSPLELPVSDPKSAPVVGAYIEEEEESQTSLMDPLQLPSQDSEVSPGDNLINILSDKQKYTSIWQLIYQQSVSSEASMAGNERVNAADERDQHEDANTFQVMNLNLQQRKCNKDVNGRDQQGDANTFQVMNLNLRQSKGNKDFNKREQHGDANTFQVMNLSLRQSKCNKDHNEHEDDQSVAMEKIEFDQSTAIKLVQEALNAILQCEEQSSAQQSIPSQEILHTSAGEQILTPAASSEEKFREGDKLVGNETSLKTEDKLQNMGETGVALQPKADPKESKMMERSMSTRHSKWRKVMMTAKIIQAMERLRKINPRKPRYLSPEQAPEEERVYLRHLDMNGRKNDEEWMLDYALRQVISRLDPDQQRRVALLVEAFERVTPEHKEKGIRCYPVKGEPAPGIKSATPMNEEREQIVESEQEDTIVSRKHVPEEKSLREDHNCEAAGNDDPSGKILQESDKNDISHSNSESSRNDFTSDSVNLAFEEPSIGYGETTKTREVPSQFPTTDSGVSLAGHMTPVLFDKQKYTSMWNLIYHHALSTEVSMDGDKTVNGFDEKEQGRQELNDTDASQSTGKTDDKEKVNEDSQSSTREKYEYDQSAAMKFVKEAVHAILQRYEQASDKESIPDHDRATNDAQELCILTTTNSGEEHFKEEGKRLKKYTRSESTAKQHEVEKTGEELQQQVEHNESKAPQRKMSKSLSRLKKAFLTAKFIKAIEKLRKISPQKPQQLHSEGASSEERVYLRHLSMDGRKNDEEWMLDYALKQVISKLAPAQQRRVALLVEAFEKVTPEQKQKSIRCYPLKGESELARSTSDEQVAQKHEDGFLLSSRGTPEEITLHGEYDQQKSSADDKVQQETNSTAVSDSTLELSEESSISAHVDVALEEPSAADETMNTVEVPSQFQSLSGDSEVNVAGDMATILSNKQKYTSMWHLIYQHVTSSEASIVEKKGENEVDDDEQGDYANKCQETNDLDSIQSSPTPSKNQMGNKDSQSAASEKYELDQSAAIKLVKEAISKILQCHEQTSDKQSFQSPDIIAGNGGVLCYTTAPASNEEKSQWAKRVERHRSSELGDKLHTVEDTSASLRKQTDLSKVKTSDSNISKSSSKLKKLIVTAKFIKAMEKLRRLSPRKPRYLSPEAATEEERVHLRHQDTNERRNYEEWMLDHALRKAISDLAPDQQRRVALLVEAFEAVSPEQRHNGIRSQMRAEPLLASEKSEHQNTTSYDDYICQNHDDRFSLLGKAAALETSLQEDHPIEISNFGTELHDDILKGNNLHSHHQVSPKGNVTKEEKDSKPVSLSLKPACSSKEPKEESEADTAKGMRPGSQKQSTMWHLIYQHVNSVTPAEAGNNIGVKVAIEDQMARGNTSSETIADADDDDSDASSVASELSENEAIKLVKEAIDDILDVPQELDNELLSGNITALSEEDQTAVGESPEKSLSRGYSKLRKLIICNKFIREMKKKRKSYPQKRKNLLLHSNPKAEKAHLKPRTIGEKKRTDDWMLDTALQKVISGLAPVQQRRVSMLVKAFEKVKPDLQETGKGFCRIKTESADGVSSAGNAKEKNPILDASQISNGLHAGSVKVEESVVTSRREVFTGRAPKETNEDATSCLSKEYELSGLDGRSDDPSNTTATTSDTIGTLSGLCKETTEDEGKKMQQSSVSVEERSSICEIVVGCSSPDTESAVKPSQPEDSEDEGNTSAENDTSLNRGKYSNLWCLLAQHINSDVPEESENQIPCEIAANAQVDSTKILLQRNNGDSFHSSPELNHDNDMDVQTPKSTSFKFQEKEAIKLVQEALDEILLLPDKTSHDQIMNTRAISDQEICKENHGDGREPLSETENFAEGETLEDPAAIYQEKNLSPKENLPNSYSKLSKVILCNRFIKAMDKMRKLKPQSPPPHARQLHSESESNQNSHSLRQRATNEQKSWEECMLDHAMQQVVGKLPPAQKKKVALLVQAFEKVASQPNSEPGKQSK